MSGGVYSVKDSLQKPFSLPLSPSLLLYLAHVHTNTRKTFLWQKKSFLKGIFWHGGTLSVVCACVRACACLCDEERTWARSTFFSFPLIISRFLRCLFPPKTFSCSSMSTCNAATGSGSLELFQPSIVKKTSTKRRGIAIKRITG